MKESEKKDKGKVRKTAQLFSLDKEEKPSSWRTGKYQKLHVARTIEIQGHVYAWNITHDYIINSYQTETRHWKPRRRTDF